MSIRRKLALWLCPELVRSAEARIEYRSHAYEWTRDTLQTAEAARQSVEDTG